MPNHRRPAAPAPSISRRDRRRQAAEARRLGRNLPRILAALSHGDPRCGWLPGGKAIRVFCPSCQPRGPRWPGDEPHLTVGELGEREHVQ